MLAATTTCHTTAARPITSHPFPSGSSAPVASATTPPTADATAADLRGALRPVLTVTPADQTSGFADHYGSHTLATLPLARTLVTGFSVDRAASFISADEEPAPRQVPEFVPHDPYLLNHSDLDALDISIRQAWNLAAYNFITACRTDDNLRFWLRPAREYFASLLPAELVSESTSFAEVTGVQVAGIGGFATSWLAHPRAFAVLDEHLRGYLDTEQVVYLAPDRHTLVALPECGQSMAYTLAQWVGQHSAAAGSTTGAAADRLVDFPLVWANGFPREYLC